MVKFDLDKTILEIPDKDGKTAWTIRDAVEGCSISGGIGSGKSSGSAALIARKYLENGFGGLVLTVKPDEKKFWTDLAMKTGRIDDLVVIEPGGPHRFNFLEFESSQVTAGTSLTANIVEVLKTVMEAGEERKGHGENDSFWQNALDMLISFTCNLCKLAYGKITVRHLYDIAVSAPKHDRVAKEEDDEDDADDMSPFDEAFFLARNNVDAEAKAWFETLSEPVKATLQDPKKYGTAILDIIPNVRMFREVHQFFTKTYYSISDRTRSTVEFMFSGFLYRLLEDPFYSLFSHRSSTITPDASLNGKIILVNLPVKTYYQVGRDCQIMFKYIWQRAIERRNIEENERPVFLFADEAQNVIHKKDVEIQATARSSRIATVYITQNLPNYLVAMGSSKADPLVKSFMGTLSTKIFHANSDVETNAWASQLIGDAYIKDISHGYTIDGNMQASENESYKLERMVRPEQFVGLKTGGPLNNLLTQAYIHHQGKPFHNGMNFIKATFKQ